MSPRLDRLILACFLAVTGALVFLAAGTYLLHAPFGSRASAGAVTLTVAAQGNHREGDQLPVRIAFYNGPDIKYEEASVPFTYRGNTFTASFSLPSDFRYSDQYALFVKPEKYTGRIFCNEQLSGKVCTKPQFKFLTDGNSFNLSSYLLYAGDIPPANGKVDAADISLILRELGKAGKGTTDVNNDGITDIIDYSLAIYSLAHEAADDPVNLTAPVMPTDTPSPTPTPTVAPLPSPTVIPSATPVPTVAPTVPVPTATLIPTPTSPPTPTPLPHLGKNCVNGTAKVSKPLKSDWGLNVLAIPYGRDQYRCVPAQTVVLHWSDSPNFLGNSATWGALNTKNVVCGLAIDDKETLQMSNFYDDKITWEGCSNVENSINIEINGTQFDLWYDKGCNIVNPAKNNALAAGELQKAKETIAAQYHVSPGVMDWENDRYVAIMEKQEKRVLEAVRYLLLYYDIPASQVTGHYKLTTSKPDPGPRFLDCIKKKL